MACRSTAPKAALAAALLVAISVAGNYLYWAGDGRPGTPAEFRDRVATAGLAVDWENNGPSGGTGSVDTDCSTQTVTIDLSEDQLWIVSQDPAVLVTAESIEAILRCILNAVALALHEDEIQRLPSNVSSVSFRRMRTGLLATLALGTPL